MKERINRNHFKSRYKTKTYLLVFAVIFTLFIFAAVKKIIYLSADLVGEKDCNPLFPQDSQNSNKLTINIPKLEQYLPLIQKGGTINDASCLNRTSIYGVVKVHSIDDIKNALIFARDKNLKVSVAGVRHSMGGQTFAKGAFVLDMTGFLLNHHKELLAPQDSSA